MTMVQLFDSWTYFRSNGNFKLSGFSVSLLARVHTKEIFVEKIICF